MRPALLEPVKVPFSDDSMKVVRVDWNAVGSTAVEVLSKREGRRFRVEFPGDVGLRILGELDLATMWIETPKEVLKATWLFVVRAGGWFELESARDDFYTKHEAPVTEFLIGGYQDCVSIFSRSMPVVTEVLQESDA
jgi:hypothetical protein